MNSDYLMYQLCSLSITESTGSYQGTYEYKIIQNEIFTFENGTEFDENILGNHFWNEIWFDRKIRLRYTSYKKFGEDACFRWAMDITKHKRLFSKLHFENLIKMSIYLRGFEKNWKSHQKLMLLLDYRCENTDLHNNSVATWTNVSCSVDPSRIGSNWTPLLIKGIMKRRFPVN